MTNLKKEYRMVANGFRMVLVVFMLCLGLQGCGGGSGSDGGEISPSALTEVSSIIDDGTGNPAESTPEEVVADSADQLPVESIDEELPVESIGEELTAEEIAEEALAAADSSSQVGMLAIYSAPVLNPVQINGTSYNLSWSQPGTYVPSGGYDLVIDSVDTNQTNRTKQLSAVVSGLTAGVQHCFQVQGRFLQASPDQVPLSNKVCTSGSAGTIQLAAAAVSVAENAGKVDVRIDRVNGSYGTATVSWRTYAKTAGVTVDYTGSSWALISFASGETSKVVSIPVIDDQAIEGDEAFEVHLQAGSGAPLGTPAIAVVTIKDNDSNTTTPAPGTSSRVYYGYNKSFGATDSPSAAPYGGVPRYVDFARGVNSGSGSISSPWKTLDYGLKTANAGDTIYLRGGVHNYGVTINNNARATQANPIEVRSYPGEWAIIDGTNIANGNLIRLFNESWLIFRNFEVRNADKTRVSNGIYAENLTDCEFHNILMANNNGAGFSAKTLVRCKFYNCSALNNVDIQTSGDSADGFSITSGATNKFYRCVAVGNSDDAYDNWAATGHYYEDCVGANSGSGSGGDGNGFKLGKPNQTPNLESRGGGHTLVRCIAIGNKFRGYSENATDNGSKMTNCIAYRSGQNWELPSAAHYVEKGISFGGSGDSISSRTTVVNSKGQGFGGTVYTTDFESVDLTNLNNTTVGSRFFYPTKVLF
jgi:hypothetical protein